MEKSLRRLLPNGQAWRLVGNVGELVEAFGLSLERARDFLGNVRNEAIPGRATYLIEAWHKTLGLSFDKSTTIEEQRRRVNSAYTSAGGSSIAYVIEQIKKEFPKVTVIETASDQSGISGEAVVGDSVTSQSYEFGLSYTVIGDVNTASDLVRLRGLITRLVLLHLAPTYSIRIIETLDTAYTGACITGKARCGRTVSDI